MIHKTVPPWVQGVLIVSYGKIECIEHKGPQYSHFAFYLVRLFLNFRPLVQSCTHGEDLDGGV